MNQENYILLRDELYSSLFLSTFIKGITIVNYWNLYGRAIIKKSNNTSIYSDFKINIKSDKIESYLGFLLLDTIEINEFSILNIEFIAKKMIQSYIKYLRLNHRSIKESQSNDS